MSGFVALVRPPGAPVDVHLLEAMTAAMAFRGPDGIGTRVADGVGLGCALLRTRGTTPEAGQPLSLEGRIQVVGHVRLDDPEAVHARLRGHGDGPLTDLELVAWTYAVRGDAGLGELRGEFSYAIWDGPARRLVCARDPLGIRALYWAIARDLTLVGNTLEALRLHPAVEPGLDEVALADFLLFGRAWDADRTVHAGIRRVPPGHLLVVDDHGARTQRYWQLPDPDALRARPGEVVEGLRSRLRRAVGDRARGDRAAAFMSGGLDSTTVAALAARHPSADPGSLIACTIVHDEALPRVPWRPMPSEEEAAHAGAVARHLGVPHRILEFSQAPLYETWRSGADLPPEPIDIPQLGRLVEAARELSLDCRVVLTGEGGDSCFRPPVGRFGCTGGWLRPWRALSAIGRYVGLRGRLPPLALRSRLSRRLGRRPWLPAFPPWLDPDLVSRHDLEGRWRAFLESLPGSALTDAERAASRGPRPEARRDLGSPWWPQVFAGWDPEILRAPVESRHPFFDERVLGFVLSLPSVPWFWEKLLLREVTRGILPEEVRLRPKAVDRVVQRHRLVLREGSEAMRGNEEALSTLTPYIRISVLRGLMEAPDRLLSNEIRLITRPLTLGWWLKHQSRRLAAPGAGDLR